MVRPFKSNAENQYSWIGNGKHFYSSIDAAERQSQDGQGGVQSKIKTPEGIVAELSSRRDW